MTCRFNKRDGCQWFKIGPLPTSSLDHPAIAYKQHPIDRAWGASRSGLCRRRFTAA